MGKGKGQDKLLDWVDRPNKRSKFDRIVILKQMFNHTEFEKDPGLINEIKLDLKSECEKFGEVKKVLIFDRNPEGVCSILFKEAEFADKCIEGLNGRYYAGKVISAETFDGTSNYQVQETEEEMEKRLSEWERFIEADEEEDEGQKNGLVKPAEAAGKPEAAGNKESAGNSVAAGDLEAAGNTDSVGNSEAAGKSESIENPEAAGKLDAAVSNGKVESGEAVTEIGNGEMAE